MEALWGVVRGESKDGVSTEFDTAGICLSAWRDGDKVDGVETPEAEVGGRIVAGIAFDLHAIAMRRSE